jgi:hypothetical protein
MRGAAPSGRSDSRSALLPAAGAGLALLVLGASALLVGGLLNGSGGTLLSFWVVGVGLAIVLAAMLLTLLGGDRAAAPAPSRGNPATGPRPRPSASMPAGAAESDSPSRVPAPTSDSPSRPVPSIASSIPAQYATLAEPPPEVELPSEVPGWDEDGVSLPFSAGPRFGPTLGFAPDLGAPGDPELGALEHEVSRLRERVHELEASSGPSVRAPDASRSLGPSLALSSARAPEPPTPGSGGPGRLCTGCGTRLSGGTNDPLCWGCGRALCATCYWRTKEGGAAHTCPACFARTYGTGVSGGRGLTPPTAPRPTAGETTATGPR